ncbi:SDR family NAD(P)-dependent oxidoreductase [Sphingomonas oryzagri]
MFGATGAIGSTVVDHAIRAGWAVTAVTRGAIPADTCAAQWLRYDPIDDAQGAALEGLAPFDAVCWAQGANLVDSLKDFDVARHVALYQANCLTVMASAAALLRRGLLSTEGARLAIVSSVWQERARQDKFSYAVTKAAVGGIVRAASVDLGSDGHLVNGVLPGVLDTPMTRANLSADQIALVTGKSTLGRLPDLATLAETIIFLCSPANNSITGQSIAVDLGMSNAHLL